MKTKWAVIAALLLSTVCFAQESQHCYNPTPAFASVVTDVCEFSPTGRVNVTVNMDGSMHSDWYTAAEWQTKGPELDKMWAAINTAQIDALNHSAASFHAMSLSKRDCKNAGYVWHTGLCYLNVSEYSSTPTVSTAAFPTFTATNKADCKTVGGKWSKGSCNMDAR